MLTRINHAYQNKVQAKLIIPCRMYKLCKWRGRKIATYASSLKTSPLKMNIVLWNSNERTELTEFLRVVDAWCWFSGQKLILFSGFPCDHKFLPQRITRNLPTHSTAFNLSSQEFRSSVQWRARIFVKSDALCGVHAWDFPFNSTEVFTIFFCG